MTSAQIRQSFLDCFASKQHTIVPSSSLMPDSPNLLFTNAGMNQFVPIFLGKTHVPYSPGRAADTQKCIRAGGKHNDLDDVGLDTYHHTFFEMLGNWSFGDYFKKEAIEWAWELIVKRWHFPANRLYATVYSPDKAKGDPADFDQEAWNFWAEKFEGEGLDPEVHIVHGNKKDNFWMMGDTGPCGPCSELHVDLTPEDRTLALQKRGATLVNSGDARCMEIWNLVFIQFNANPDGTFSPLPAQHVDTGMGFERVASIIQGTHEFSDFAKAKISNYETDIFRPIFDELEKMSGHKYGSTLPAAGSTGATEEEKIDVSFRVIADHIRTLTFAVADGIQPGNTDRHYVLRRILRRAVRYGRTLGFHEPFFYKLVAVLARTMGDVFPEVRTNQAHVEEVLKTEEEAFNKTLDRGLELFETEAARLISPHQQQEGTGSAGAPARGAHAPSRAAFGAPPEASQPTGEAALLQTGAARAGDESPAGAPETAREGARAPQSHAPRPPSRVAGAFAFKLYDTYGFPLDLTELMARERGLTVDTAGFETLMEEQRARARAAQKKEIISVSEVETTTPTRFLGYDGLRANARVVEVLGIKEKTAVILDSSTCYAEMGGQVGDTGELLGSSGQVWRILNTQKAGNTWLHFIEHRAGVEHPDLPAVGETVSVRVDSQRRWAIERHHTVTHLLHWALHEVVSIHATQKGSFVGPDKLTFDFNSPALTPTQVRAVERLVNERIVENAPVTWSETPYAAVKTRADVMHMFGDKYGETVRVVQIGGKPGALDGYSMELCGGTHTRATGELGLFRIVSEAAIAAGVRRIEAVAGLTAYDMVTSSVDRLALLAGKLGSPLPELEKKLESLLAEQKEAEKQLEAFRQKQAAHLAATLMAKIQTLNTAPAIIEAVPGSTGDELQAIAEALKGQFKGVLVLVGATPGHVALMATVSPEFVGKFQAGKVIQAIAPIVGGKGGGRPDSARGAGKEPGKVAEALARAKELLR